jgi:hypothetical protein
MRRRIIIVLGLLLVMSAAFGTASLVAPTAAVAGCTSRC